MTDRELLERAARAAGLGDLAVYGHFHKRDWNPLADDGDALRLAVDLGIHITSSDTDAWASTVGVTAIEPMTGDKRAATRRAIVRAAAAMDGCAE